MLSDKKNEKNKLIPLRRFVKDGLYSAAYLSILVQRKKLKAKKIGRNFFTTKNWFNEYLETHASDKKRQIIENLSAPALTEHIKQSEEKDKALTSTFPDEDYMTTVEKKVDKEKMSKKEMSILKDLEKTRDVKVKLVTKRFNWSAKLVSSSIFILIFIILSSNIFPINTVKFFNINKKYYSFQSKIKKLFNQPLLLTSDINKDTIDKIDSNTNIIIDGKNYFIKKRPGRVAGVSEENLELDPKDKLSKEEIKMNAKKSWISTKNQFKKLADLFRISYKKVYLVISDYINPFKRTKRDDISISKKKDDEGIVVIPFKDEKQAEEIKQQVEQMFSDDIEVEPDESGRVGIIKPVFGSETEDQEYLYMMVPVNEEENIEEEL